VIWTHSWSLAGKQGISGPVSLLSGLLAGLFSHLRVTHRIKEEDTFGGILFLRLKVNHLRPEYRVLNSSHYALL
jgi:hypothetical protein